MKVAIIAPSSVPFVFGGAERLYDGLHRAISARGDHQAELIKLPSPEHSFGQLARSYELFAGLDLEHFDMVISTKYPSWMVRHRNHVVWMLHPLRGLYDQYPTQWPTHIEPTTDATRRLLDALQTMQPAEPGAREEVFDRARQVALTVSDAHPDLAFPGPLTRAFVRWLDADALDTSRIARYLAISNTVAARGGYFPAGVEVAAVYPPSNLQGFENRSYTSFFTASRLDDPKRLDVLIHAMRHTPAEARLRIAGTGPSAAALHELARDDARIEFLGHVTDQQLLEEYGRALAVPFIPVQEDFGLVALEAHMASKPVITAHDSGGATEIVQHRVNGLVVDPTPEALGAAMTELLRDRELARSMGEAGRAHASAIGWEHVVDTLVCADPRRASSASAPATGDVPSHRSWPTDPSRPKVVLLSTYCAFPARHGGQLRVAHFSRGLAERMDVHLVGLADGTTAPGHQLVGPHLHQWAITPAPEQAGIEHRLSSPVGTATGDIAATFAFAGERRLLDELAPLAEQARCVVLEHPYMWPLLEAFDPRTPVVYDAHNVEAVLKGSMYADTPAGRALAAAVHDVERAAVARANLVVTCSDEDAVELEGWRATLADFVVIPNGTAARTTRFVCGAERRRRRERLLELMAQQLHERFDHLALFVGSAHLPNMQAARSVIDLARVRPDTLFLLVGGHADHLPLWNLPPNVVLRGPVSDAEFHELLSACDVALNPMEVGSGTNIKLLDYFASGAPAIATAMGARGLPVTDSVELLIADPRSLASALERLLTDEAGTQARALRAREVAMLFDWSVLAARFTETIAAVIDVPVSHALEAP